MTAKVFCMASAKGGSGKTVLTATFGAFLVGLGKKVLFIDTDAATNGLTLLYLKEVMLQGEYAWAEGRQPRGVYEVVSGAFPPETVKLKTGPDLIPATYEFFDTEKAKESDYRQSLQNIIGLSRDSYDYIFLDSQAGSDIYAQTAMSRSISDEVIIVSEYDPMSAAGVERLKGLLREDLTYVRTWVLLNKMLPEFVQSFSDFLEVAKYLSPIPWDADVVRAYARRRLALDIENGNEYTLAVLQSMKSLLGDDISEALTSWATQRAATIRQPIEEQYQDAERELEALLGERYFIEHERLRSQARLRTTQVWISLVAAMFIPAVMIYIPHWTGSEGFLPVRVAFAIAAGLTVIIFMVYSHYQRFALRVPSDVSTSVEEARLRRREAVIQERLSKLEMLRTADLDILIRHGRSIPPLPHGKIQPK